MERKLKVSSNPHIRSRVTTNGIMMAVVLALLPAAGLGICNFGIRDMLPVSYKQLRADQTELDDV
ncbi:MAG: RnfABCDGE type electron transport complex subunit D, partial [Acetatifactor sp.]|nr:RnfABCDGE type electron transport complex subunit D [Acetatifactor sp.]